jgi:hypothetical protein
MSMLQDIRIAFRFFSRAPAPTAIALLSIALSVGATAVVFAGIKSVLIDALPYAHPEQLALVPCAAWWRGLNPGTLPTSGWRRAWQL